MEGVLRVGAAVFNAGDHHAAHDAWEARWLELDDGTPDERLLHGLIQYTAAVHHARNRNWSGATGLATSAREYLGVLDADYRGVNVGAVRAYLERLAADPEFAERARPLPVRIEGRVVRADDLPFEDIADAARLVAEEYDAYDENVVERAVTYATEEVREDEPDAPGAGGGRAGTRYVAFLFDFVGDRENRDLLYDRLFAHVERERARERDVSGLFD